MLINCKIKKCIRRSTFFYWGYFCYKCTLVKSAMPAINWPWPQKNMESCMRAHIHLTICQNVPFLVIPCNRFSPIAKRSNISVTAQLNLKKNKVKKDEWLFPHGSTSYFMIVVVFWLYQKHYTGNIHFMGSIIWQVLFISWLPTQILKVCLDN